MLYKPEIAAMFTGIIETLGIVKKIESRGTNIVFWIASSISDELHPDQSVSHNGACLTIEEAADGQHRVTAIEETLLKTNLGGIQPGDSINLERCLPLSGRLDGHPVQGHVDTTAICTSITDKNGSWEYQFTFDEKFAGLIIEKGSIAINGISLTLFNISFNSFCVGIIPYTYQHTNLKYLQKNNMVNIEFDMIGKYVVRGIELKESRDLLYTKP